jgi:hypothetical protein
MTSVVPITFANHKKADFRNSSGERRISEKGMGGNEHPLPIPFFGQLSTLAE